MATFFKNKIMKKNFVLLLIIGLFSSSCAIIYGIGPSFTTDVLPEYKLAAPMGNVVIVNSFDFKKLNVKNDNKLEEVKAGVIGGFNGLGSYLTEMTGGNYYNIADTAKLAVNTDSISAIAAKYHAAYVVALTNFFYNTSLDKTEKRADKPLKEAYFNLEVATGFIVYNTQGQKLKEFKSDISEPFTSHQTPGSLIAFIATPSIKRDIPGFNRTVKNSMTSAFKSLLPTTAILYFRFFSDVELRPAIKEYNANRLDESKTLLEHLLSHPDAILAGKAAFNLAVVYYTMGLPAKAKEMAEMSLNKFDNPSAHELLDDLSGKKSILL